MCKVFVLDTEKRPLDPIHSALARQLLSHKKAAIYRRFPFIIILKESHPDSSVTPMRLKLDPGAKTTGIALVNDATGEVVFAAELKHRGLAIREALTSRRQLRRGRRARKTRYSEKWGRQCAYCGVKDVPFQVEHWESGYSFVRQFQYLY